MKPKLKLSPWWIDKPVNGPGVYEVDPDKSFGCCWFSWWDGKRFNGQWKTPERAYLYRNFGMSTESISITHWRGIVK